MKYIIREMRADEYPLLDEFLYNAIYIPKGVLPPPKSIIQKDELQVYVKNFGERQGDLALVAEADGKAVGAVWARIMDDYGHIDNETPSLAISLYEQYRGFGMGTAMMKAMLLLLRKNGYMRTSLAVQKENYAVKMYKSVGFYVIDENDEEFIMACDL